MSNNISIVVIILNDNTSSYGLEFLEDRDSILPVIIKRKNEKEILKRKEYKTLQKILNHNPKLVSLIQENKSSKKIAIETSQNLKKQILIHDKIKKNGEVQYNEIVNLIRNYELPYCILDIPEKMELVDKIMLEKNIMERFVKYVFSNPQMY